MSRSGASRSLVQAYDRHAVDNLGVPEVVLMENAGRAVGEEAARMVGALGLEAVAVIAGAGQNGGDGFVAARHIARLGVPVKIHILSSTEAGFDDDDASGTHFKIARNLAIPIETMLYNTQIRAWIGSLPTNTLLVDALLGVGVKGEVREPARSVIRMMNACGFPILSVDVPSGLDPERGRPLGVAIQAKKTVTFVWPKRGFFLAEGPKHVGEVVVSDIGLPRNLLDLPHDPAPDVSPFLLPEVQVTKALPGA